MTTVLVLGGSRFAESVCTRVRKSHAHVYYGSSDRNLSSKMDGVMVFPVDPSSQESVNNAFKHVIDKHGHIDTVLVAYLPPKAEDGKVVPGADLAAIDSVVDPAIRASKCELFHLRRIEDGQRRMAILSINGPDVMARTAAGALLGLYRAIEQRFTCLNAHCHLVRADNADDTAADTLAHVATDLDRDGVVTSNELVMHLVRGKEVMSVCSYQGTAHVKLYGELVAKVREKVVVQENALRWQIRSAKLPKALFTVSFLAAFAAMLAVLATRFQGLEFAQEMISKYLE